MRFLDKDEMPTMQMIRDDLINNPPGQGVMHMHLEFTANAPFYIVYLMAELEKARQSKRQRRRQPSLRKRIDDEIKMIRAAYFNSKESQSQAD